MRTRAERRKLTYKHIRRNIRINSVYGKKGNSLSEKEVAQPHRLYKGKDYDGRGGFSRRSGHLGPSRRDLKNDITSKEMLNEDETD